MQFLVNKDHAGPYLPGMIQLSTIARHRNIADYIVTSESDSIRISLDCTEILLSQLAIAVTRGLLYITEEQMSIFNHILCRTKWPYYEPYEPVDSYISSDFMPLSSCMLIHIIRIDCKITSCRRCNQMYEWRSQCNFLGK